MKSRKIILVPIVLLLLSAVAAAKDEWITVRSRNFHLVGNAKAAEIRRVAKKLEQFRLVFSILFPKISLNDPTETKVFVFKSAKSFKPFLPKKANGKPDTAVTGYFVSTEEANYIALSTEGSKKETYQTIFHEYVHFLLNANYGGGDIPPWLNEGLAEYYSTFEIDGDKKVNLGNIRPSHLYILSRSEFIPLRQFFGADNYSLHKSADHSRTVFYAQAWALVHYFAVKKQLDRADRFIELSKETDDDEAAFEETFGVNYEAMETILRNYVKQRRFTRLVATFKNKLAVDEQTRLEPLAEAKALAYLGNLFYHRREFDDAEEYARRALALDPGEPRGNAVMGLIKAHRRNFVEAKRHLEKAVISDVDNHYVHYSYAFVLSREQMNEAGYVAGYDDPVAETMRTALRKSISLKPDYIPSYNLMAFVNLVTGDRLDESIANLQKVLLLQPGNERATLTLAQIHMKMRNLAEARKLAETILNSSDDPNHRSTARMVINRLRVITDFEERNKALREELSAEENRAGTLIVERDDLTDEELERMRVEREISTMNQSLLKPARGESRVLGYIKSIECDGKRVSYLVSKEGGGELRLISKGFQKLELLSLAEEASGLEVGCGVDLGHIKGVMNYRPGKTKSSFGTLRSITFVPARFRIKSPEEIDSDTRTIIIRGSNGRARSNNGKGTEAVDGLINESVREGLRKPKMGESRLLGRLTRISCDSGRVAFHVESPAGPRLFNANEPQKVHIMMFGFEAGSYGIGCGKKPPQAPVVVTYRPDGNTADSDGSLISLEFVPEGTSID